jgi:hypothetical protein
VWRVGVVAVVVLVLASGALFKLRNVLTPECPGGGQGGFACPAPGWVEAAPRGPPGPYESCQRLARQLSTPVNAADVALAWACRHSNRNPVVRRAAIEGCREGIEAASRPR